MTVVVEHPSLGSMDWAQVGAGIQYAPGSMRADVPPLSLIRRDTALFPRSLSNGRRLEPARFPDNPGDKYAPAQIWAGSGKDSRRQMGARRGLPLTYCTQVTGPGGLLWLLPARKMVSLCTAYRLP